MTEPLYLTDLNDAPPDLRRFVHGYRTSGTLGRFVLRIANVGRGLIVELPRDARQLLRPPAQLLRVDPGTEPAPSATRIALYVHYSRTGEISEMVRRQLGQLRDTGFAVVLITMAARVPEADWQAARELCALVVQRENFGRDFGAWRDTIPIVLARWPAPTELLLVNDSVLGPIYPLAPVIDTLRRGGPGLFGLTESWQGGVHLQSYMLLGRGESAVSDLVLFLQTLRLSHSKWLLVRYTELRLARWMRQRGHRVAAAYGYERVTRAAIADPAERRWLMGPHTRLHRLERLDADEAMAALSARPLNPSHHLWHVLATKFAFPFLKTELILRNPGRLPNVNTWPEVIPPGSPCPPSLLRSHLATIDPSFEG